MGSNAFNPGSGGVTFPITIAEGGTNAATAPAALANLGAMPLAGGAFTGAVSSNSQIGTSGQMQAFRYQATGQTGAATSIHYCGATTGGPPLSGSFATGDLVVDITGQLFICTAGGSPGTFAQVASGRLLCPPVTFAPATVTALTVSAVTLAAFDTGVVHTGSFLVPPSGAVYVRAVFEASVSVGGATTNLGLAPVGTTTLVPGAQLVTCELNATTSLVPITAEFLVSGLTPGTAEDWDLVGACTSGDSFSIQALGSQSVGQVAANRGQPVLVTVMGI